MAGNIQNVSFASPQAIIAPDLVVEQQQIERARQLAQALREEAMQDTQVAPGSKVAVTQGLARVAEALMSNRQFKKSDAQQTDIGRRYAARLSPMFGAAPPAQPMETPVQTTPIPASSAPQQPAQASVAPDAGPQPPAAQPVAAQPQTGALSLTGDPQRDMTMYSMGPEDYIKAVIAKASPTDMAKQLEQAGIAPGSALFQQLMQMKIAHDNYTAPLNGRPGSTIRDPYNPSHVLGVDAPSIEGATPNYGSDGMPTGYTQLPGATQAIAAASGAKTAGANANEPITGYDANGNPMFGNKLDAAHGNGGIRPAPPPGFSDASAITGKNSAQAFQNISDGAADVPNRVMALKNMQALVNDPSTVIGPGSTAAANFAGRLNTIGQTMGIPGSFNAQTVTNVQEFSKWASQYSARSAQELGLSGSDARVNLAIHATPNGEMAPGAVKAIIPQMIGMENAKQGYAIAANQWQQTHGPQTVQQFRTQWNQIYEPQIYTHMAQGAQAFTAWSKSLSPEARTQMRDKYVKLKALGALPQ